MSSSDPPLIRSFEQQIARLFAVFEKSLLPSDAQHVILETAIQIVPVSREPLLSHFSKLQETFALPVARYVLSVKRDPVAEEVLGLVTKRCFSVLSADLDHLSTNQKQAIEILAYIATEWKSQRGSIVEYCRHWCGQLRAATSEQQQRDLQSQPTVASLTALYGEVAKSLKAQESEIGKVFFNTALELLMYSYTREHSLRALQSFFPQQAKLSEEDNKQLKDLWSHLMRISEADQQKFALDGAFRFWRRILPLVQRGHVVLGENFSSLLRIGLSSTENLSRKQALHMLKALVTINSWLSQSNLTADQWKTFVLLYETLDESTAHLLQPLWPQIDQLLFALPADASSTQQQSLGGWSSVLLTRALEHPSPVVKQMAVALLMRIDTRLHPLVLPVRSITKAALRALEELPRERGMILSNFVTFLVMSSPEPGDLALELLRFAGAGSMEMAQFVVSGLLELANRSPSWDTSISAALVREPSTISALLVDPRFRASSAFGPFAAPVIQLVCRSKAIPADFILTLIPHLPTVTLRLVWPQISSWAAPHSAHLRRVIAQSLESSAASSTSSKFASACALLSAAEQESLPERIVTHATLPPASRLTLLSSLIAFSLSHESLSRSVTAQAPKLVSSLAPLIETCDTAATLTLDALAQFLETVQSFQPFSAADIERWRSQVASKLLQLHFSRNAAVEILQYFSALLRLLLALVRYPQQQVNVDFLALLKHVLHASAPPHRAPESLSAASFTDLVSTHVRLRWELIWFALQSLPPLRDPELTGSILERCSDALDVASSDYLLPLYQILDALLHRSSQPLIRTPGDASQLHRALWHSFEQCKRKTAALVSTFVPLLLSAQTYTAAASESDDSSAWQELLSDTFHRLLSIADRSPRVAHALCSHVCSVFASHAALAQRNLAQLVSLCLLPLQTPSTAASDDVAGDDTAASPLNSAAMLMGAYLASPTGQAVAVALIPALLDRVFTDEFRPREYAVISATNKRKLSMWRALCISSSAVSNNPSLSRAVNERLWKAMALKNHGNVRYYMQLFATAFLVRDPASIATHFLPLLMHYDHEYQVATSLLIVGALVLLHAATQSGSATAADVQPHLQPLFDAIVPWTNHYHHAVHVSAQVLIHRVMSSPQLRYLGKHFEGIFAFLCNNKDAIRLRESQNKLPLRFDAVATSSFEGVYLNNADLESESTLWESVKKAIKVFQASLGGGNRLKSTADSESSQNSVFQKRILPWEEAFAQLEAASTDFALAQLPTRQRQSLIVVASFLDNTPNIAGLARTSEIFGVAELAVPNKKIEQEPHFQRISVSAEKHLPIVEVTAKNLQPYLQQKKSEGYSVIAIEQTASSTNIAQFKFPKKSVLVLGQEQEGVPPDALQWVDYCVEIPQLGTIRSLNAHVSGSVVIWEYTKQQNQQKWTV